MTWAPESDAQRDEFQRQVRLLTDQDPGVRRHALDAVKAMGPRALSEVPAFIKVLNKQFLFAKEKCLRALSQVGQDVVDAMWSVAAAEASAKKSEKSFRAEAAAALKRVGEELK